MEFTQNLGQPPLSCCAVNIKNPAGNDIPCGGSVFVRMLFHPSAYCYYVTMATVFQSIGLNILQNNIQNIISRFAIRNIFPTADSTLDSCNISILPSITILPKSQKCWMPCPIIQYLNLNMPINLFYTMFRDNCISGTHVCMNTTCTNILTSNKKSNSKNNTS